METSTPVMDAAAIGAELATERERQGLSRGEIAQRLHMSVGQVEALETGEYTRLPKGPFLRGFARNYAKALGLDPDAVLARLAEAAPQEAAPRIVVPTQNIRFDPIDERMKSPYVKAFALAGVTVVVGFAALYWFYFIKPMPPAAARKPAESVAPNAPASAASPSSTALPPPASEPLAQPKVPDLPPASAAPPPAPTGPTTQLPAVAPGAPGSTPPAPAVAAPGQGMLRLRFKGEAWVEVRDARGKLLHSRTNAAGTEAAVAGEPPLSVVVGNAADVQVSYNDRPVALEPHTRVSVARFTIP